MILPADRGKATVVLDKEDYNTKVKQMLSDTKTCEVLKKDPTPTYRRKLVSILSRLKQEETSSAVAEMGACGHNRHGPKRGGWCCAPFAQRWEPV